jgi:hypothetical protein
LPSAHVNTVLEAMLNDMGHPGKDEVRRLWSGDEKIDVSRWCLLFPASVQSQPFFSSIVT